MGWRLEGKAELAPCPGSARGPQSPEAPSSWMAKPPPPWAPMKARVLVATDVEEDGKLRQAGEV